MSGDLMSKGITELLPAKADSITGDDLVPVYQKKTLQVMKVTVRDLALAIAREVQAAVDTADEAEPPNSANTVQENMPDRVQLSLPPEAVPVFKTEHPACQCTPHKPRRTRNKNKEK